MKKRATKLVLAKETVLKLEGEAVQGGTGATCTCTNSNYVDCPPSEGP